jgi:hypothetical protein
MWRRRVAKHSKGSHTGKAGTYPRRAANRAASVSRSSAIRSLASQITVLPARSAKSRCHEASSRSFSGSWCWRVLTSYIRDDLRRDRMAAQTLTLAGSMKSSANICLICRETIPSFRGTRQKSGMLVVHHPVLVTYGCIDWETSGSEESLHPSD